MLDVKSCVDKKQAHQIRFYFLIPIVPAGDM